MISNETVKQIQGLLADGVPHREICRRTHVSRGTVGRVASGRRRPRPEKRPAEPPPDPRAGLGVVDRILKTFGLTRRRYFASPDGPDQLRLDLRDGDARRHAEVARRRQQQAARQEPLPAVPFVRTECARCGTPLRAYLFRDGSARIYDDATLVRRRRCPGCDRDLSRATVAQVLGTHDEPEFVQES